jgi:hypothetical protein
MPNLESLLHSVRQRINYQELFEEFLTIRGRGANRMAFCPWHENTDSPALSINVDEGLYQCMNPECGAHGDFVTFYMRMTNTTFAVAVEALARRVGLTPEPRGAHREEYDHASLAARHEALIAGYEAPSNGTQAPEQVIDDAIVQAMHERLLASESELAWLEQRRGITRETVEAFKLGHDGQRYYIPVRDAEGRCVNIRRYAANTRRASDKMISWRPGFGQARLFPLLAFRVPVDDVQPIVICEGEMDCLLARQLGLNAVTATGGAGTWKREWNPLFAGRDVVIAYDRDGAGAAGATNVAGQLHNVARRVRVWQVPLGEPSGADVTDYFHGHGYTVEDFWRDVEANTRVFQPPAVMPDMPQDGPVPEKPLSEAARGENRRLPVICAGRISGIESSPSLAPEKTTLFCGTHAGRHGEMCETCPNRPDANNGATPLELTYHHSRASEALDYVNVPSSAVLKALKGRAGIPQKCPFVSEQREKSLNILAVQVIPEIDTTRDDAGAYVTRRAFQIVKDGEPFVQANHAYRLTLVTTEDPKTQSVVHVIVKAVAAQSDIDVWRMSVEVRERMQVFQPAAGGGVASLWERLGRVYDDLERVTRIYQRRDLALAVDLTYHSVVGFVFQGERVQRGWMEALIIGDSRTGKTTVVQRMLDLYRAGEFSSGENTSFAGLVGGLNELQRSWFTRWGKVPLNDRRLLVIDEAGNLPTDQIARMSSMRSSGIAEVVKIHAERTYARTRQIWISNPRGNRPLSTYSQGVLAVKELIGAPEDIARFDLVVTAGAQDVSLATINAAREAQALETYTGDLFHQRVMWAWSRRAEQVLFTPGATQEVLRLAMRHGEQYRHATEIPLVEPNEQRIKLARIAVAVAAFFFSTEENGERVVVLPEHALFAAEFLDRLYGKPSLAFDEYARQAHRTYELQADAELLAVLRRSPEAARALMEQQQLTQADLQEILGYDERAELRPALSLLRRAGFLRRVGSSFYVKTPAAITWLREELTRVVAPTNGNGNGHGHPVEVSAAAAEDAGENPPW